MTAHGLDPWAAVPLLAPVLGIGPEHGYDPVPAEGRKLQELIAEAIQRYLLACSGRWSGLVVAEDCTGSIRPPWRCSARCWAHRGRLLVVLTGRDGGWPPAEWPVKVFDLAPLTAEQTDELIIALDPTLTGRGARVGGRRCDGMPFYIEQVVAGLK